MKITFRFSAVLLAVTLLLGAFVSCGGAKEPQETGGGTGSGTPRNTGTETVREPQSETDDPTSQEPSETKKPSTTEKPSDPEKPKEDEKPTETKGLKFEKLEDGTYAVIGIGTAWKQKQIVIPSLNKGKAVTAIADHAFEDYPDLKSVLIPDSVTSIGARAFASCTSLLEMVIPDSVTSIGSAAFSGCLNLVSVTIGSAVTNMGDGVFSGCLKLMELYNKSVLRFEIANPANDFNGYFIKAVYTKPYTSKLSVDQDGYILYTDGDEVLLVGYSGSQIYLTLPDGITGINDFAFYQDNKITTVTLPDSLTSIGILAFSESDRLRSVAFGAGMTSIGNNAFSRCSALAEITVADGNPVYHSAGNCLIETATGMLTMGCKNSVIPADGSVTGIGAYAFETCYDLTEITIPDHVTSIGEGAFNVCSSLTDITIGNGVTHIGKSAFAWCFELTEVTIPDSVRKIDDHAFDNCKKLETVVIGNGVTHIGDGAFDGCEALVNVSVGNNILHISVDAFNGCDALQYNDFNGGKYFGNSTNPYVVLMKATETSGVHHQTLCIYDTAFSDCGEPEYTLYNGGMYLGDSTNPYMVLIKGDSTSGIHPDTRFIGNSAFEDCESLETITIPAGVISIGCNAFEYCRDLKSIVIPDSVRKLSDEAFRCCYNLKSVVIPDGVVHIGYRAFSDCSSLTDIVIAKNVTKIDNWAFAECRNLEHITVASENPVYHSAGNCLIETATGTLILGCKKSVIPSDGTVTVIGERAFNFCEDLTEINIPDSVVSIEESAFSDCSRLTDLYITDLAKWCEISFGFYANPLRNGCNLYLNGVLVRDLVIPDSVTSIGEVFSRCKSLTSVTIPENTIYVANDAFFGCNNLASITVASGNPVYHSAGNCLIETATGTLVFGCKNSVIPSDGSVTVIGDSAFGSCESLAEITIPDSVTKIGSNAFSGCLALTEILIPGSVTEIGDAAFSYCGSLTEVTIPSSVTEIGCEAFLSCSRLTTVVIGDGVTEIGSKAFWFCENLAGVTVGSGVLNIGDSAFFGCSKLVEIYNRSGLNITVGSTENGYIGCYAKAVHTEPFDSGVSRTPDGCILYTDGDTVTLLGYTGTASELTLPDGITVIGSNAFSGRWELNQILIPVSVVKIEKKAFAGCGLRNISYAGTYEQWVAIEKDPDWGEQEWSGRINCLGETWTKNY